jgi:hypothetical protein
MGINKMVRVWNDNVHEHEEKFKGQVIKIEPKSYIEMNSFEAVEFKSQFKAPVFLKGGVPDPRYFKKIRIEHIEDDKIETSTTKASDEATCQKCGFAAKSMAGLKAHIRANHIQSMENDDARRELLAEV